MERFNRNTTIQKVHPGKNLEANGKDDSPITKNAVARACSIEYAPTLVTIADKAPPATSPPENSMRSLLWVPAVSLEPMESMLAPPTPPSCDVTRL